MASSTGFVVTFLVLMFVAYSYQLQCYTCTTDNKADGSCGDFSDEVVTNCTEAAKVCQKVDIEVDGNGTVSSYSCGTTAEDCEKLTVEVEGLSTTCFSCDTDKCNSATGIVAATSVLALSLIAAILN